MTSTSTKNSPNWSSIGSKNVKSAKVHERRIKNLLTEWSGVEFRRRRVEGRGDDVKVVEGVADVIPVDGEIWFAIEAKKEKKFSLDALMASLETAVFTKWWHQVTFDASLLSDKLECKRYPMLFFKPIPNWDWVAIDVASVDVLRDKSGAAYDELWFPSLKFDAYERCGEITKNVAHNKKKENAVMVPLRLPACYMCRWRDFEEHVDPKSIFVS